MTGTVINAIAIFAAILLARSGVGAPDASRQQIARKFVAAVAACAGAVGLWASLNGPTSAMVRQLLTSLLALVLGNLTGKVLKLQPMLDHAGVRLGPKLPRLGNPSNGDASWLALAALLFLNPLTIPGAIEDGLDNRWLALAAKSLVDAISLLSYGKSLGVRGGLTVLFAVCGLQGVIATAAIRMEPWLAGRELKDSVLAVVGLMVIASVPALAGIRKAKLANLLPSLVWGPFLTWLWRL